MNDTIAFSSTTGNSGDTVDEAAALAPWWQNLHLPDGAQTAPDHPLGDFPQSRWEQIRDYLPDDLSGCTALDIGCNAGFFSIELARRGAEVTAIDRDPHVLRQAQWAAARHGLQDRITLYQGNIYDLARLNSRHDIVLFMDLFGNARYPLLALDIAARLVRRCFVFQYLAMPGHEIEYPSDCLPIGERVALTRPGWPKLAFIEGAIAGEPGSWWAPNRAGAEAMLRSAGLEIVARPGDELILCQPRALGAVDLARTEEERDSATGLTPNGIKRFGAQEDPVAASEGLSENDPIEPAA